MDVPVGILWSPIKAGRHFMFVHKIPENEVSYDPAPITIAITPPTTTSVDMTIRGVICSISRKNILERKIAINGLREERGPTTVTGAYQSAE